MNRSPYANAPIAANDNGDYDPYHGGGLVLLLPKPRQD